MTMPSRSSSLVTVNLKQLLRFMDEKPACAVGHATGVVGVAGEDLGAACFQHYVQSKSGTAQILKRPGSSRALPVNTGMRKGPWLDRWIDTEWSDGSRSVFQTEIKSWSAHAVGGTVLPLTATREEVRDYKQARWERRWDSDQECLRQSYTSKVLSRMKLPDGVGPEIIVRPLLIFWEALAPPENADAHLFSVEVADGLAEFNELWVFSVSSYLRNVLDAGVGILQLDMPDTAHRLGFLNKLFSVQ